VLHQSVCMRFVARDLSAGAAPILRMLAAKETRVCSPVGQVAVCKLARLTVPLTTELIQVIAIPIHMRARQDASFPHERALRGGRHGISADGSRAILGCGRAYLRVDKTLNLLDCFCCRPPKDYTGGGSVAMQQSSRGGAGKVGTSRDDEVG